jgi:MscS family membrane protein
MLWAGVLGAAYSGARGDSYPLKPPDRSSPRATLQTFFEAGDTIGSYLAQDYIPAPSRAKYDQVLWLARRIVACLDLSEVPPASRGKAGTSAAGALYETLSRIQLPPWDQIPDAAQMNQGNGISVGHWVIPNTEIVLERVKSGPHTGDFIFSGETVRRADEFYEQVRRMPYVRPVPLKYLREISSGGGGWMIPFGWIKALPPSLKVRYAGQAAWKWIAFLFILSCCTLLLRPVWHVSRREMNNHPFLHALLRLALPLFFLLATPAVAYFALIQINFFGPVASAIEVAASALMFVAGAWIVWRIAPVVAEAIIATPKINTESIDAHLIRICSRLLGMVGAASLLALGAQRLGLPVYGIVAGLGVGGLAIALAAQPTIENLIGGLSLFADKPIRVGDLCQYAEKEGYVEAIGFRSTRIRGRDRTLTTVPNAMLSKMPVISLTQRDQMLIQTTVGLRYETTPDQLRSVLKRIREMFLSNCRIDPELVRARFVGFGASSLDIEIFAYVKTRHWTEFLSVREEILLRIMEIVNESGTSFAFPSRTVYFGRDSGFALRKSERVKAAMQDLEDSERSVRPDRGQS